MEMQVVLDAVGERETVAQVGLQEEHWGYMGLWVSGTFLAVSALLAKWEWLHKAGCWKKHQRKEWRRVWVVQQQQLLLRKRYILKGDTK